MTEKTYGKSVKQKQQLISGTEDGRQMVEDLPHSGREKPRSGGPSISAIDENIQNVKEMVFENHRVSARDIIEDFDTSCKSVVKILNFRLVGIHGTHDNGMRL